MLIQFFADFSHPQTDGRLRIEDNELIIDELRIGDTGAYRCTSISGNAIDNDEDVIHVFVNGKQLYD